ncbi:MAG: hypothetical protein LT081_05000 [Hydrogenophaga sp.]|nr:hypothetical protein [Hydrogenophaga sp.]
MKKQAARYKAGILGFLGELRWLFGAGVGMLVAALTETESNPVELGFLGLSLWIHLFLGAASAILVAMVLKSVGVHADEDADADSSS